MIEPVGAVDVVGVSSCGRGASVKRLPDLANHKKIIDLPRPQRPENSLPPGRTIAASGPDRRHGVAPMWVLGRSGDGIDHMHEILDASSHPSRNGAGASRPPFPPAPQAARGGTPAPLQRTLPPRPMP